MIELTKVRDGIYLLDRRQFVTDLTGPKLDHAKEVLGPFVIGWITERERGTDGHMYKTQQLAIQFENDNDAVMFTVIVNG